MGICYNLILVTYGLILCNLRLINGFGTYGFNIHHRYSDPVKGILDIDDHNLPKMGSLYYYSAMAHRDRLFHRRRLAGSGSGDPSLESSLTFLDGNETFRIPALGYLHYANVSVGTPSLWFLVALDTGSDLFWIPCDCQSCVKGLVTRTGRLDFNIYSPNTSSTSDKVPCNSSSCELRKECTGKTDICPYQVNYVSPNTSSTGILIEDILHLTTEDSTMKAVNAKIKFGCGMYQTGSFLEGGAPNGLFGLGMKNISVPSTLASNGLAANSFSMCFGSDGLGRINFGDKGSSDQGETPINLGTQHQTYNISMTKVAVGNNVTNVDFTAIFDTGTSFTYLNDPAYSVISKSFDSQIKEARSRPSSDLPFKHCYNLSPEQNFTAPLINLTMKGGDPFTVMDPLVFVLSENSSDVCLGIVKSEDINIIGQNFMTGYRVVFDREKNILGWKPSNCYKDINIESITPAPSPLPSPAGSPPMSEGPRPMSRNVSPNSSKVNTENTASTISYTSFILIVSIFTNFLMVVSM
uniref:aspartyl protease family protein 1-like isoform X2 n=1 Tax=Erigeron canadensis TaxID=72917 RepID=UPI001CB9C035|nr:aspartyl protease family protein 1-like isoform X2 [Erigeron canadensis]